VPVRAEAAVMDPAAVEIGARQTMVRVAGGATPLALGFALVAEACLHHDPPTPAELERAIEVIEDELMRARRTLPGGTGQHLIARGAALNEVVRAADGPAELPLDAVERLFQRLASEALGDPSARRGLPAGNQFVATVLILREFMHHLGFISVRFEHRPH
jgi:exopolyphosphatase/pppGpp-phosphohydrolase